MAARARATDRGDGNREGKKLAAWAVVAVVVFVLAVFLFFFLFDVGTGDGGGVEVESGLEEGGGTDSNAPDVDEEPEGSDVDGEAAASGATSCRSTCAGMRDGPTTGTSGKSR